MALTDIPELPNIFGAAGRYTLNLVAPQPGVIGSTTFGRVTSAKEPPAAVLISGVTT